LVILGFVAPFLLGFIQNATSPQSTANVAPTAQSIPPTPSDPKERLELGRKLNGLQGVDTPWHLEATYEVLDAAGKSKDKGTFEEWWVSEKRYKLAYHSAEFSQEEYGTDHGIFHTGDARWPSSPVNLLQRTVSQPLPLHEVGEDWGERNFEHKLGAARLTCTALSYRGGKVDENSPSFCFEPTKAILRYSNTSNRTYQILFDNFVLFRGRLLARDVRLLFLGKLSLTVHIDTIEPLKETDLPSIPVSANLVTVTKRVQLSAGETNAHLLKKAMPEYSATAKMQGVQGTVVLDAIISKDGYVREMHVLAGPPLLQKSAIDAVQQWLYKPYVVDGEAVEVETEVNVVFNLGGQ
jgi:TonB family protein